MAASTDSEWRRAGEALEQAARLHDAAESPLPAAAREARSGGFASGADWMALALGVLRGVEPPRLPASLGHRLGFQKYALATLATAPAIVAAILWHPVALLLVPWLFYAVESRLAFVFPLALDGEERPLRASWRWTRDAGWLDLTVSIMRLATVMLTGGLLGRGFLRSWCLGCLAVLVRYEQGPPVRS